MLPSDWLRKYSSIYFVRIRKLNVFTGHLQQKTKDIFLTPEGNLHKPYILFVYVESKRILLNQNEPERQGNIPQKTLKFP